VRTPLIVLASSLSAALVALGIAAWSGWFAGSNRTVVIPEAVSGGSAGTPVRNARPAVGNGFDPSAIYSARSPGVVVNGRHLGDEAEAVGLREDNPQLSRLLA